MARKRVAAAASPLERTIGYVFRDSSLLERALTHSSYANQLRSVESDTRNDDNEVLEFLGDSVLGSAVSEWLVRKFPLAREGELTRKRAALVNGKALAHVAATLKLGEALHLGRGEELSGGRRKANLGADAVEAVAGAIYLDGGWKAVAKFALQHIIRPALDGLDSAAEDDAKSKLQEWLQARRLPTARYEVVATKGPDHARRFTVELTVERGAQPSLTTHGEGANQRAAQQESARLALAELEKDGSDA